MVIYRAEVYLHDGAVLRHLRHHKTEGGCHVKRAKDSFANTGYEKLFAKIFKIFTLVLPCSKHDEIWVNKFGNTFKKLE